MKSSILEISSSVFNLMKMKEYIENIFGKEFISSEHFVAKTVKTAILPLVHRRRK